MTSVIYRLECGRDACIVVQQASFEQFLQQPESQALVEHHQRKLAQRLARRQEERRSKEFRAQVSTSTTPYSRCCRHHRSMRTFSVHVWFLQSK